MLVFIYELSVVGAQRNYKSASGEEHSQQNGLKLKSSLKKEGSSLGPRTQNRSVKWADEERSYAKESSEKSDVLPEEDAAVRSLRFASAEACAEALSHAADIAASSGNSQAEDAGTCNFPTPLYTVLFICFSWLFTQGELLTSHNHHLLGFPIYLKVSRMGTIFHKKWAASVTIYIQIQKV